MMQKMNRNSHRTLELIASWVRTMERGVVVVVLPVCGGRVVVGEAMSSSELSHMEGQDVREAPSSPRVEEHTRWVRAR
jgi:hypothetical protein